MTDKPAKGTWRYAVPFALFIVLGAFLFAGLHLNPTVIESPLIGKTAPEFSLPNLHDMSAQVGTQDFGDRFVLLNVWATWCVECRREHPYLMELADSGVPIYGIDWKDDSNSALEWLRVLGDPYAATGVDRVGDVAIDYGVYGAPETFLIGPDGKILKKRIGVMTPNVWETEFLPAIESARSGG